VNEIGASMNLDQTVKAIQRLFDKHRILFWYDTNKELRQEYEALEIPSVKKLKLRTTNMRSNTVSCVKNQWVRCAGSAPKALKRNTTHARIPHASRSASGGHRG